MPRWSCSKRLLRYLLVRCWTWLPSVSSTASGQEACPTVVTRSGVEPTTARSGGSVHSRSNCWSIEDDQSRNVVQHGCAKGIPDLYGTLSIRFAEISVLGRQRCHA